MQRALSSHEETAQASTVVCLAQKYGKIPPAPPVIQTHRNKAGNIAVYVNGPDCAVCALFLPRDAL